MKHMVYCHCDHYWHCTLDPCYTCQLKQVVLKQGICFSEFPTSFQSQINSKIWLIVAFLNQGIFPTQGSNPGLSYCRQSLYCLSHQGSPMCWLHWYKPHLTKMVEFTLLALLLQSLETIIYLVSSFSAFSSNHTFMRENLFPLWDIPHLLLKAS